MIVSTRYHLVVRDDQYFLVSSSSLKILKALLATSDRVLEYDQLSKATRLPVNSLYVFCERLESAKLVKRLKSVKGMPRRVRTEVHVPARPLLFPSTKVIR